MAAMALTDRYAANLHGALSCYDRIIITGALPGACYAGGMTSFLYSRSIRIFDCPRFAQPFGQIPFRAVRGVANPRHSGAMAAVCALHSIPKRCLCGPAEIVNTF